MGLGKDNKATLFQSHTGPHGGAPALLALPRASLGPCCVLVLSGAAHADEPLPLDRLPPLWGRKVLTLAQIPVLLASPVV